VQPTNYTHIATKDVRRTDIIWEGKEDIDIYDKIVLSARQSQQSIADRIKDFLKNIVMLVMDIFTF